MKTVKLSGYGLICGFKMSGYTKYLVSLPVKWCPCSVKSSVAQQWNRSWKGQIKHCFISSNNDVILTATPKVLIFQLPHRESNAQVGSFWLCYDWCYIVVSALEILSAPNSNVRHKHPDSSHNRSIDQTLSLSAACMGGVSVSRHGIKGVSPTGLFPANIVFS